MSLQLGGTREEKIAGSVMNTKAFYFTYINHKADKLQRPNCRFDFGFGCDERIKHIITEVRELYITLSYLEVVVQ